VLCGGRDAAVRVGNLAGPEVIGPGWPVTNKTVTRRDDFRRTAPVGSFPIEPFGLYDISGNVSEWTSTDYRAPDGRDTTRPLLCGPSWLNGNRSAEEFSVLPANVIGERIANAGFRVVIAPVVE
jgi:formylglycine-generating enzyme required for sulfatase activity